MTAVDAFYESANILMDLTNTPATEPHRVAYETILASTQAETTESLVPLKIMTSATIVRYIDYFESHNEALNSLFDLCEDSYLPVRLESIKNLFNFAVKLPKYTTRIIDVLLQLLQSNEEKELKLVKELLIAMFKKYPKDCCSGLFHQIENGSCQSVLLGFVEEQLMEHLSPALKVKFFNKFLRLLDSTALENCSKVLIDLIPDVQDQETVTKLLDIRLKDILRSPDENTVSNILGISELLKKGKQMVYLEDVHRLFELGLLNTPVLQLNILKLMAEISAGINQPVPDKIVDSLVTLLAKEYLPLIIEAQNGKINFGLPCIEPVLFIVYRAKKLSESKQNSEILTATLKSLYQPVVRLRDQLSKSVNVVKYKILYANAKNAYTLTVEILKEERMADYVGLAFSWLLIKPEPIKRAVKPKPPKKQTKQAPVKIQTAGRVAKKKIAMNDATKRLHAKAFEDIEFKTKK
ncbi:Apoptosis inhibitor 5 [Terramyces sp. JEL0728]|nr:Apoptosis inhibitor 5 [Terramyces sp. JEL0728]